MNTNYFDHKSFYETLKNVLSEKDQNLNAWLGDLLKINKANISRRRQGKIVPRIDEILKIFHHSPKAASLCLEMLSEIPLKMFEVIEYNSLKEFIQYLKSLNNLLMQFEKSENPRLLYSARDIPIFMFFNHKAWVNYKVKLWIDIDLNEGPAAETSEIYYWAKEISDTYQRIPSYELWYNHGVPHQLMQLETEMKQGWITEPDYHKLKSLLKLELEQKLSWMEKGEKMEGVPYSVYSCRYMTLQNGGLLLADNKSQLIGSLWNAQTFSTHSPKLITDFQLNFNRHKQGAINISKPTPAPRNEWWQPIQGLF